MELGDLVFDVGYRDEQRMNLSSEWFLSTY